MRPAKKAVHTIIVIEEPRSPPRRLACRDWPPSRALFNGAPNIERADKLVQIIAKQKGLNHPVIDANVALVDELLDKNREKAVA